MRAVEMGKVPTRPFPEPLDASAVEQRNQDAIAQADTVEPLHNLPNPETATVSALVKGLKEYWLKGISM